MKCIQCIKRIKRIECIKCIRCCYPHPQTSYPTLVGPIGIDFYLITHRRQLDCRVVLLVSFRVLPSVLRLRSVSLLRGSALTLSKNLWFPFQGSACFGFSLVCVCVRFSRFLKNHGKRFSKIAKSVNIIGTAIIQHHQNMRPDLYNNY